ncbi:hypothetical protein PR048_018187 [Dryococelus australis]|uniref:Uncharacterized protein n=1 Tax=Dryococelus australis TaxID=614101 RepID=A0ABQ9HBL5_9NEOP|nr:hypothetical protein PR048_018187 [Dryococelus australis]
MSITMTKPTLQTIQGIKYPEEACNASKASISIMMCGSATCELLASSVVYRTKHLWLTWTDGGPQNSLWQRVQGGIYLKCLNPSLRVTIFPPHMTRTVSRECKRNTTSFVCLPSNRTHLNQPFDVAACHPKKCKWRKILREYELSPAVLASSVLQKQYIP